MFDRVQDIKTGKHKPKATRHSHTYRRLLTCGHCGRSLYGERQKGRVYMRCQTSGCPTTTIREDRLDGEISHHLLALRLRATDERRLQTAMRSWIGKRTRASDRQALDLQLANLEKRQAKLTDALVDGLVDKSTFQLRNDQLDDERAQPSAARGQLGRIEGDKRLAQNFLELAKNVHLTYQIADPQKKRRLTEILFSNRTLTGKNLCLEPQKWLFDKAWTLGVLCGGPDRDTARTRDEIMRFVEEFGKPDGLDFRTERKNGSSDLPGSNVDQVLEDLEYTLDCTRDEKPTHY
ncbi:MAG: zinc ribbon domain-containing protein [Pseudomonadota bacterium]